MKKILTHLYNRIFKRNKSFVKRTQLDKYDQLLGRCFYLQHEKADYEMEISKLKQEICHLKGLEFINKPIPLDLPSIEEVKQ